MKKIILSSIFSMMAFSGLFAQLTVADTALVLTGSAADAELYGYTILTNETQDTLDLRWVRTIESIPQEWDNYFCAFPGLCGLPWTDSLDFELPTNFEGQLQCHFEPNDFPGVSEVTVRIYNNADDALLGTVHVTADAMAVSTNELEEAQIKLFPNPASNYFHLSNSNIVDIVEVYNILGKKVKAFARNEDDYFIGDLSKGIYMIRLIDLDTDATKTLKLKKD